MSAIDLAVRFQVPASRPLSVRSNFGWAVTGNAVYAICQWGMIVALAKFGTPLMIGQFSLGLAIVTPVLMLTNFDLRAVQATDACRQYRFADYLRLRILSTLVGLGIIAAIVWIGSYDRGTAAVILAVALAKAVETLSDIHYGLFQLNDRLDQTGRSMILRGVLSLAALSSGLYLLHDVLWGCVCVALAWAVVLVLFDARRGRHLVAWTEQPGENVHAGLLRYARLLLVALPLGIVTTVASLNLHMPRYFIHARMGERALGIFSAMAYATVSLTLIGDSLGNAVIPRLSRLFAAGQFDQYRALLLKLFAIGVAIGSSALALAATAGTWLLTIFYNTEYAAYAGAFTLLMAATAIHFAASMLTAGITSARRFRIQAPLYILVACSTAWGCARFVPAMGLAGAAVGVIIGAVVRLLLAAAILRGIACVRARHS